MEDLLIFYISRPRSLLNLPKEHYDVLKYSDYLVVDSNQLIEKSHINTSGLTKVPTSKSSIKSCIIAVDDRLALVKDSDVENAGSLLLDLLSPISPWIYDYWVYLKCENKDVLDKLLEKTLVLSSVLHQTGSREGNILLRKDPHLGDILKNDILNSSYNQIVILGNDAKKDFLIYSFPSGNWYISRSVDPFDYCHVPSQQGWHTFLDIKNKKRSETIPLTRHADTKPYKKIRFNGVVIEYTRCCNAKCNHCYVSCSPETTQTLKVDKVIAVLKKISHSLTRYLNEKKVCIAGGEVTLPPFKEDLIKILKFAKMLGFKTEIVTNGYLFTHKEFYDPILEYTDYVEVSITPFHVECLGKQYYKNVLENLKKTVEEKLVSGAILRVQTTKTKKLNLLYKLLDDSIEGFLIASSPISWIGRARERIPKDEIYLSPTPLFQGGCWYNLNLTITSSGDVTPCCAGSELSKFLKYGNVYKEDIADIVEKMVNDPYLYVLTRYPERLVHQLSRKFALPPRVSSICEICLYINTSPVLYNESRKFVEELVKMSESNRGP
ncbi:radical SAM/SPASM domain-containing protein [Thermococcus celericrescens]|nr:radical SAM/SPASM domain-containing protein [Thermococcus celericrescens]